MRRARSCRALREIQEMVRRLFLPAASQGGARQDRDSLDFHAALRAACDVHAAVAPYEKYKKWCDDYFYLPHRKEARGRIGIRSTSTRRCAPHATCTQLSRPTRNTRNGATTISTCRIARRRA